MDQQQRSGSSRIGSHLAVSLIVGSLYVAACASPAIDWGAPRDYGDIQLFGRVHYGIVALVMGWVEPLPWSANLLLVAGWILLLLKQDTVASVVGIVAVLAGL